MPEYAAAAGCVCGRIGRSTRLALDTIASIFPRGGGVELLLADPDEHGRCYGEGESLEEAQEFSRECRDMLLRAQLRDRRASRTRHSVTLRARVRGRGCGGRPRGRRTRTASRAGPSSDDGGGDSEPPPEPGWWR